MNSPFLARKQVAQSMLWLVVCCAYYPYCAYSPYFSCPLPPRENWLNVPIRAGEKDFK